MTETEYQQLITQLNIALESPHIPKHALGRISLNKIELWGLATISVATLGQILYWVAHDVWMGQRGFFPRFFIQIMGLLLTVSSVFCYYRARMAIIAMWQRRVHACDMAFQNLTLLHTLLARRWLLIATATYAPTNGPFIWTSCLQAKQLSMIMKPANNSHMEYAAAGAGHSADMEGDDARIDMSVRPNERLE